MKKLIEDFKKSYEKGDREENDNTLSLKMKISEYLEIETDYPDFQRSGSQWDANKAVDLFTTISLNQPLPKFIVGIIEKDSRLFLMDGKQRTETFRLILDLITETSKKDMLKYLIDVDVVYFDGRQEMGNYFLRVNACSGLTQAQKLKATMDEKKLQTYNVINYDENMVNLLTRESDAVSKELELSYIKNGKTEELTYILLAIANTNKVTLKNESFTTGATGCSKVVNIVERLEGVEMIQQFLKTYTNGTRGFESRVKVTRTQLMCLLFQAYVLGEINDIGLLRFFDSAYEEIVNSQKNVNTVEDKELGDIFKAGSSNAKTTMSDKYKKLIKYLHKNYCLISGDNPSKKGKVTPSKKDLDALGSLNPSSLVEQNITM